MKINSQIQGREEMDLLLIDFEHEFMDVRDPVDGICRIPLKATKMPVEADLSTAAKKVIKPVEKPKEDEMLDVPAKETGK